MAPTTFFEETIPGSSFAEPDGTKHEVVLFEGEGRFILRVHLEGQPEPVDLLFEDELAVEFFDSVRATLNRMGLRSRTK